MLNFQIRLAIPGDESAIHEAHMRSIREVCVKDHGIEETRGWGNRALGNRWVEAIKSNLVWVVEADSKIFGQGYVHIFEETVSKRAHIHGLYLTPEAIGLGLGAKLTRLMLGAAKDAGVSSVTLESTITAHDFYKKMGFQDTGPISSSEIAGVPVRYYPMELKL